MPKHKLLLLLLIFLFAIIFVFFLGKNQKETSSASKQVETTIQSTAPRVKGENVFIKGSPDTTNLIKVSRVIDGDTIELENGQKVRYIGINTPETVDPQKPVECFGKEASDENKKLIEGQEVILEKDVSETDKYGRLLRYVYLPQSNEGGTILFVNDYLVREGFAQISTFPPDVKYQNQFLDAQREAQSQNKGLWGSCNQGNQSPQTSSTAPNGSCVIKGNISASGEKIYHMPGQKYYNQTVIDETKGERWFCTEDEAISAGWRKSKV